MPAEQVAKEAKACEAGVSIKPGAQAPGSKRNTFSSPRMRATERLRLNDFADKQLSPISWAHDSLHYDPGAYAPGFMLTPASQALTSACFAGFNQRRSDIACHPSNTPQ